MKRPRLAIVVGAREARAMLVRAGVVQWHTSAPMSGVGGAAAALRALMLQVRRPPFGTRIAVVVSPAWVQVKPLAGLPSINPARLASQLLRENQQAFFLWKGRAAAIADIHRSNGQAWGAAFDSEIIDEVTKALRETRLNVGQVAPAVVAIAAALPNRAIVWSDGDERLELEGNAAGLTRVERPSGDETIPAPTLPAPLASLGDDALRFLDAYAAAIAPKRLILALPLHSAETRSRLRARSARVGAGGALAAAAMFAALGPGLRAHGFARVADDELARHRRARLELATDESDLRRVTQSLVRIESFRAERGKVTRALGELAQAVPESTAMLTFHVDSLEGAFTAIAPHVADVLPELATVGEIAAPRIVGSVTREVVAGVPLERATFRFRRWRPASPHSNGRSR